MYICVLVCIYVCINLCMCVYVGMYMVTTKNNNSMIGCMLLLNMDNNQCNLSFRVCSHGNMIITSVTYHLEYVCYC